jgi:hypothetical protein
MLSKDKKINYKQGEVVVRFKTNLNDLLDAPNREINYLPNFLHIDEKYSIDYINEDSFIIYIVNDTNISFSFEFELNLNGKIEQNLKQHISANNYFALAEFESAMLNDSPKISLKCPAFNLTEQLNLKYKKWISMLQEVPIIGISCRAQLMFSASRFSSLKTSAGDLSKYTKDQLNNSEKDAQNLFNKQNKAEKLAHFNKELDLHAEVLIENYRSLNSGEILERQKKQKNSLF